MVSNGVLSVAGHASPVQASMVPELSQGSALKHRVHGSFVSQKMDFSECASKFLSVLFRKIQHDRDGLSHYVLRAEDLRFDSVDGPRRKAVTQPFVITRSVKE